MTPPARFVVAFSALLIVTTAVHGVEPAFRRVVIEEQGPQNPWTKIIGDVDGDGRADLIVGGQKGPLVWYAYPHWEKTLIAESGYATVDGEMGDVDGDGDPDVVMGGTLWYENPRPAGKPSAGPWKSHRIDDFRSHDVELGDLDRDGDLDVVGRDQGARGNVIKIWRQDSSVAWTATNIAVPRGEGLRLGDLDRDGDADIVINGLWFENPGKTDGSWSEHRYGAWHETSAIDVGDMNGDGRLDVVLTASEAAYRGTWFEAPENARQGDWREHVFDDSLDYAHGVWAVDLDGDGDLDLATAEMHQSRRDRVLIYWNQGRGLAWDRLILSTKGLHDVFVADIGGDDDQDILGANWSGPYQPIELWENQLRGPAKR